MSGAIDAGQLSGRPQALDAVRPSEPRGPAGGVADVAGAAIRALDAASALRSESPLEAAIGGYLTANPRLTDVLGAPQFPLALKEAILLLEDLAAAGGLDAREAGGDAALELAGAEAEALDALTGAPPPPSSDDAAIFADAAAALQDHLDARAAFRADAAKLVKT